MEINVRFRYLLENGANAKLSSSKGRRGFFILDIPQSLQLCICLGSLYSGKVRADPLLVVGSTLLSDRRQMVHTVRY